ncbi:hypothetical protein H0H92_000407 [Tricholoma furcatifolium]|nr:hypothetical protein H0H92_000407 [Tricholoma furcatifolium]
MSPGSSPVPATPSQASIPFSLSTPIPEYSPWSEMFYENQLHAAMAEEARQKRLRSSSPVEPISKRLRSHTAAKPASDLSESKGPVALGLSQAPLQEDILADDPVEASGALDSHAFARSEGGSLLILSHVMWTYSPLPRAARTGDSVTHLIKVQSPSEAFELGISTIEGEVSGLRSNYTVLREQRDRALSELAAAQAAVSELRSAVLHALNALQTLQANLAELEEL